MKKSWYSIIPHWIFPLICCFCGEQSNNAQEICDACFRTLPWLEDACYYCGRQLTSNAEHIRCQICEQTQPNFDRLCALFKYEPPITKLITRLKFYDQLQYGRILGQLFSLKLNEWYKNDTLPEALIPVPLHLKRLRKRGYNQALEFMWPIAKYAKIKPLFNICKRIKLSRPQSSLNKEQRRRNLSGVFQITHSINTEHVAIVDDVVTTGSTVSAVSIALREAGVKRIDVFAACRA